jgi:SAM-dependent methyltransferase
LTYTTPTGAKTMSPAFPEAVNYHRYLYRRLRPHLGRRVWEIGAGYGQYTAMLLDDAREVLATDVDTDMLEKLEEQRKLAGDSRLSVSHVNLMLAQTIQDCAAWAPDSVLCLNVLEHIDNDRQAVEWLFADLPRGCTAVFLTPALPSLYGFMDAQAGHIRRYTRKSLTEVFAESGWKVEQSFYLNPIGGLGWFVRSHVLRPPERSLDNPWVNHDIRFFDRYLVPLTSMLDPVFAGVFGQSVVVVATKP